MARVSNYHKSVLLQQTIDGLQIKEGEKYIDATLGGGGHSFAILEHGGRVLGIDQDEEALAEVREKIQESRFALGKDITLVQGNFNNIENLAVQNDFTQVSGILFDVGVSSHQIDSSERGFSFQTDSPLDMRMDKNLSVTAADLVNGLTKGELIELFVKYGEEKFAGRIANNIVKTRLVMPIVTTAELARLIEKSYPVRPKIHPATRVFQALRIAVNDELNALRESLPQALGLLKKGGVLAVISFHSLEDRIVKESFEEFVATGMGQLLNQKPIVPEEAELGENRRSRSAKLRLIKKL